MKTLKSRLSKKRLIDLKLKHGTDKKVARVLGISKIYVAKLKAHYGISNSQIRSLRNKLNIPCKIKNRPKNLKYKPRKPKYTKEEMIRLQNKFFTDRAIGKYLGISESSVFNYRNTFGLAPMPRSVSLKN